MNGLEVMKRYSYGRPTNSLGITTLFEHRVSEFRCLRHDRELDDTYPFCGVCSQEEDDENEESNRQRRVSELREALRPLVKELCNDGLRRAAK